MSIQNVYRQNALGWNDCTKDVFRWNDRMQKASFGEMILVKMTPEKLPLNEMTVGTKFLD